MKNDEVLELLTKIDNIAKHNFTVEQEVKRAHLKKISDTELSQLYNETDNDLAVAIEYAIRAVKKDIYKKTKSEKDRLKGAKYILKTAKSVFGNNCFQCACIMDNKQYITNTTCAVILEKPLPLETCSPNQTWLDMKDKINSFCNNVRRQLSVPINMPDKTKLDAYIKVEKARNKQDRVKGVIHRIDYNFGENLPKVNAELLSAMLDIFPDSSACICAFDSERSAILFTSSDNSIGVLLPVSKNTADIETTVL